MDKDDIKLAAKIEQRVKDRDKMAVQLQKDMDIFAKGLNALIDHDLKTYSMLTNPDSLYYDSPISRAFTWEWVKQYLIKKDMDFLGVFLDGKVNIVDFVNRCSDASKWILRFTKEPEKKKSGIELIL